MKALVVYESMFGDTAEIAEAVGSGIARHAEVQVVPVADASTDVLDEVDLLVVGAPTHVHGLPRPSTRRGLVTAHPVPDTGVREWLSTLVEGDGRPAATFDTRLHKPRWLVGAASGVTGRRLRRRGWQTRESQSFFVATAQGPLEHGELARAVEWGAQLAAAPGVSRGQTSTGR